MAEAKISCRGVWKLYGPRPAGLMREHGGRPPAERVAASGHIQAVRDASFDVAEGEILVVMGLSGSGKSTLVRCLSRLVEPTAGEVFIDGQDLARASEREMIQLRRHKMGMVFQHFALFPHRNVIYNVGYGLKVQGVNKEERDEASMKALALVGLQPYARSLPRELSGGMQQRVGLARALASDPDILLMDEAFSALDPLIRRQMQDELMDIQNELHKTILFITHDLNEALRIGDRVCIMKDGAVVQIGTPEEILTEPATAYVAEFVQDVDQGRVIECCEVMTPPDPIDPALPPAQVLEMLGSRTGAFVCDPEGRPTGLLTASAAMKAMVEGAKNLAGSLRSDFDTAAPAATLNSVYAAAGRGLPIAVVDGEGRLAGNLDPRSIMEEMGRVEQLIDGFERQTYL